MFLKKKVPVQTVLRLISLHFLDVFGTWSYKDSEVELLGGCAAIVSLLQDLVDGSIFEQ